MTKTESGDGVTGSVVEELEPGKIIGVPSGVIVGRERCKSRSFHYFRSRPTRKRETVGRVREGYRTHPEVELGGEVETGDGTTRRRNRTRSVRPVVQGSCVTRGLPGSRKRERKSGVRSRVTYRRRK